MPSYQPAAYTDAGDDLHAFQHIVTAVEGDDVCHVVKANGGQVCRGSRDPAVPQGRAAAAVRFVHGHRDPCCDVLLRDADAACKVQGGVCIKQDGHSQRRDKKEQECYKYPAFRVVSSFLSVQSSFLHSAFLHESESGK